MALNSATLKTELVTKLKAQGFKTDNEHAKTADMAQAIAEAVVEHILANAEVKVTSGSSAGDYGVS